MRPKRGHESPFCLLEIHALTSIEYQRCGQKSMAMLVECMCVFEEMRGALALGKSGNRYHQLNVAMPSSLFFLKMHHLKTALIKQYRGLKLVCV